MKQFFVYLGVLLALAAAATGCANTQQPDAGEDTAASQTQQAPDPGAEQTRTFADVQHLYVEGSLQHIVATPSDSGQLVIRWTSEGTETITESDGLVSLSFPDPDWRDPEREDMSPRFAPVSTIYLELPTGLDTVSFISNLGDITIDGVGGYNKLVAHTVDGGITTRGTVGIVMAETGEGAILPDTFADEIVEQPYSEETTSKHLTTTIPGGENDRQNTVLYTVWGDIIINQ